MEEIVSSSIGLDTYQTVVSARGKELIADEPLEMGGTDLGLSPYELLLSSLGACTCITLRMYADRKKMLVDNITVKLTLTKDVDTNAPNIHRQIDIKGAISTEDRERLFQIANRCPVHQLLTHPLQINSSLL